MLSDPSSLLNSANQAGLGESLETGVKKIVEVPSRFFLFEVLVRDDNAFFKKFSECLLHIGTEADKDKVGNALFEPDS